MAEGNSALVNFLSDPATLAALAAVAAGAAWYISSRPSPVKPPIQLDHQSIELPVSRLVGDTPRNLTAKRGSSARSLYYRNFKQASYLWCTYLNLIFIAHTPSLHCVHNLCHVAIAIQAVQIQGGERIRKSHFVKGDEPVSYRFEDARTLHEIFQRGKRESSKFNTITSLSINYDYVISTPSKP